MSLKYLFKFNKKEEKIINKDIPNENLIFNINRILNSLDNISGLKPREIKYDFKPPEILKGVVPDGITPAVKIACDSGNYGYNFNGLNHFIDFSGLCHFSGFPGFQYLSMLSTIAEYRQFAEVNSNELTREWIKIISPNNTDVKISKKIEIIENKLIELKVRDVIRQAAINVELFGHAQLFVNIEGSDTEKPLILSKNSIKKKSFIALKAVEPFWTTPINYNSIDPTLHNFYVPDNWYVLGKNIHKTRLISIITRPMPDVLKPYFNFAGISLSQLAEPYVENWIKIRQAIADLIYNFSILTLKTDMSALLQGRGGAEQSLIERIKMFIKTRNNQGLMLLDKDAELLEQIAVPLAGLNELQIKAHEMLSTVSGIPAIKLLGVSPGGFNATADGEIRAFYDKKSGEQEAYWKSAIKYIINLIMVSEFGEIDKNIDFMFNPLWQMDEKEHAEIRLLNAQADSVFINDGVFSNDEIRKIEISEQESRYNLIAKNDNDNDVSELPEFTGRQE